MKSYNTAQYRLNTTGAGMVGFEYSNFEEEVVTKHCIYYHELKPILADRPNVTPWATNFDSCSEGDDNVNNDDDAESVDSDSSGTDGNSIIVIDGDDITIEDTVRVQRLVTLSAQSQTIS